MDAVNYSDFRTKLKSFCDKVEDEHEPLIVTRKNNKNIVVISSEDYNSLLETVYLLSSENNAKALFKSIKQAKEHKIVKKDINI